MELAIGKETYTTFDDLWEESSLTPAEKEQIMLRVDLMGKLIEARRKKGISQNQPDAAEGDTP